jgi:MOSC domain-containing protein YiiM
MQLHQIFVGQPREVEYNGKLISTGIFKEEVSGSIAVNTLNLEGDRQADLRVHGGIYKAVHAYPREHYDWWKEHLPEVDFQPGLFGENLSVSGLDEQVQIGDEFAIG